jgi:hypothetical protein
MPWFKRDGKTPMDDIPEELKELTPEQIAQAVRESQTLKAELAGQKTENETIKARLAQLEANPNNKPPEPSPDSNKNRVISFLEDEDAAFNQRAQPIVAAVYTMGAAAARQSFESGLSGIDRAMFQKFGPEVDVIMKTCDAPTRATADSWKRAWNMVKGEHLDEITKAAQDKTDFFSESSSGSLLGGPVRTILPDDRLTDEELRVAKKYNLDPRDFLEQRKSMQVYHD